jgi:hypothetical protein
METNKKILGKINTQRFTYRGAALWNDIPVEFARAQSLAEFKSKIS